MLIKGGRHGFEEGKGKDERKFPNIGFHFSNFGQMNKLIWKLPFKALKTLLLSIS